MTKSSDFVLDHLLDPERFVAVHPIIFRMTSTGRDNEYIVYEKVKLGWISYSFRYKATITGDRNRRLVHIRARVMRLVTINMEFRISPSASGCEVEEEVTVHTWLPVRQVIFGLFREQHALLFRNIEQAG